MRLASLAACLALVSPALAQDRGAPDARRYECAVATKPVAQALAEKAAAHLRAVGPDKAYKDFQDPKGGFLDGDLYVFVFSLDAQMMANGGFPRTVGRTIVNQYTRAIVDKGVTDGKGWVDYNWRNPCTNEMAQKSSYVIKVGDVVVGVGAYIKEGV